MNERINELIKDLPPELREKAKECKTLAELNDLAADNDIELPEDALENVSGGYCNKDIPCPKCGTRPVIVDIDLNYKCEACGCRFDGSNTPLDEQKDRVGNAGNRMV